MVMLGHSSLFVEWSLTFLKWEVWGGGRARLMGSGGLGFVFSRLVDEAFVSMLCVYFFVVGTTLDSGMGKSFEVCGYG